MEKMFRGISETTAATYNAAVAVNAVKSTTESVFDEFKLAAAVEEKRHKVSVACTPEERQELDLFEKVEAEIDKFGDDVETNEKAVGSFPIIRYSQTLHARCKPKTLKILLCYKTMRAITFTIKRSSLASRIWAFLI